MKRAIALVFPLLYPLFVLASADTALHERGGGPGVRGTSISTEGNGAEGQDCSALSLGEEGKWARNAGRVRIFLADASTRPITIPAGDLMAGLDTLTNQTKDIQLLYRRDQLQGIQTKGINGSYTTEDAIKELLEGTRLRLSTDSKGVMLIVPAGNATAADNIGAIADGTAVAENLQRVEAQDSSPYLGTGKSRGGANGASQGGTKSGRPREDGAAATRVSEGDGVLSGSVKDVTTGAGLKGARISIPETGQNTVTDDLGKYRLAGMQPGTYTVIVSYLGYGDQITAVTLKPEQGLQTDFVLSGAQEIVVYGSRSARAQALNQERTAENSSTVLSADFLGQFDGTTISESLRRAPGVTFERDPKTGDGTNIAIRGLAPDYNTVKLNGVKLPEGVGAGRSPSLSNILTESISKVTISKTLLPNQDSSGAGGIVEIETKTPLDRPRRYASFMMEGARRAGDFNEESIAAGTLSGLFGADEQFGLSASVQYRDRELSRVRYGTTLRFGQYLPLQLDGAASIASTSFIDPRMPFPFEPGANEVYPSNLTITSSEGQTENIALTLSGAWAIKEHTKLLFDYQRLDQKDTDYSSNWAFSNSTGYALHDVASLGGEERQALEWRLNQRVSIQPYSGYDPNQKTLTDVYSFRGKSETGRWRVSYLAGYTEGTTSRPSYSLFASSLALNLQQSHLLPQATHPVEGRVISPFRLRMPSDNSFPEPLLNEAGFELINAADTYSYSAADHIQRNGRNRRYNGELTARFQVEGDYLKYLELGATNENAKFSNATEYYYGYSPLGSLTLADLGLPMIQSPLSDVGVKSRIRGLGRADVVSFLTRRAPSLAVACDPTCPPGAVLMLQNVEFDPREQKEYTGESEWAAWLQGALQFGKLEFVGGVRMTRVAVETLNFAAPTIFDENSVFDRAFFDANKTLLAESAKQTDWLPRVVANYRWNDNFIIRAGYYLSLARPQIQLLSDASTIHLQLAPFFGPNGNQPELAVAKGNPDLKPARTHSFDASVEYYDEAVGAIKVGAFYKRIDNFLENNTTSDVGVLSDVAALLPDDPRFQDVLNNPEDYALRLEFPVNNPSPAHIWGVEASLERRFNSLPGAWGGLGVYSTYTFTDSSKDQPDTWSSKPVLDEDGNVIGFETEDFVVSDVRFNGQAKHSGTFGLTYNKYGVDATLAYTWQARRQLSYRDFGLHQFEEAFDTLDLRTEYGFKRGFGNLRVYFEGVDLLRGPHDAALENTFGADDGVTPKYYSSGAYFGGRQFRLGFAATF